MQQDEHERLRDFATRYTAAWCSQDPDRVAAFFAVDGTLAINGAPAFVGREAVAGSARNFMTAFPDLQVFFDGILERDGRVIYQWTLEGTHTGPGGTGRRVRISGFEAWRLDEDGLVADSLGHFDPAEYRRQLEGGGA